MAKRLLVVDDALIMRMRIKEIAARRAGRLPARRPTAKRGWYNTANCAPI